ncbi:MAG: UTP--glucose-1-phosphate uridylyltransferase GalU [Geodermatophilaceae bacterium]|jgi:UTP--glucose-1-phosphate uridylyltransferase|nr:UTP--glucose-1-phosphate uridylyltransferase GalU [Geodermatophilaceae bacterium]MDQ3456437.1 UTP--glucose-1-phosphate uridylyltransferase GalU [Actinomycetota bacterium]
MTQAARPDASRPAAARKAVVPVAGLGTRFLPATKAVPKELLPVVDKPALQYIVEEAVRAGLSELLMVTGRGKEAIAEHFDRQPELEAALEKKGDAARLSAVRHSSQLAQMHFVRQGDPQGLGHAVLQAASFVGDETFAVLLGDDLIDDRDRLLERMLDVQVGRGGSVVALLEVPRSEISKYGCASVEATSEDDVWSLTDLVEKPSADVAPSNLAVIGRYVLSPTIFDALRETGPGAGGEIQLTDGIRALIRRGEPVHGVVFRGRRYDTGDRLDYLKAIVRLAVERDDIGPDFRTWLDGFVAGGA